MYRSFSNRILGGVCGGLGEITPLSARFWRLAFVLLTVFTVGAGALIYMLWWWLLPLDSPTQRQDGSSVGSLFALLLTAVLVGGYLIRGTLQGPSGTDLFTPIALLILGVVFLFRQIVTSRHRGNIIWGLVAVAVPLVFILGALDTLPTGIYDILLRAWPAILVFIGLSIFLRDRVRLGNVIALVISVVLAGGIAYTAYTTRLTEERTDNTVDILENVEEDISLLQINIETQATNVEIFSAPAGERSITASYLGSMANEIEYSYINTGDGRATFELREEQDDPFPLLESIGRGTLRVVVPQDIAMAMAFAGDNGSVNLDLDETDLERLNMQLLEGDALVTLPEYQPLSPSVTDSPGEWRITNGDLRVRVQEDVGVRFILAQDENQFPEYNDLTHAVELTPDSWILVSRQYEALPVQLNYRVAVPNGSIRLDVAES